ncbi:MAG: hypothetical protein ACXW2B_14800, partial [Methylomagnum sp.]
RFHEQGGYPTEPPVDFVGESGAEAVNLVPEPGAAAAILERKRRDPPARLDEPDAKPTDHRE